MRLIILLLLAGAAGATGFSLQPLPPAVKGFFSLQNEKDCDAWVNLFAACIVCPL